jgi:hypothetical protein
MTDSSPWQEGEKPYKSSEFEVFSREYHPLGWEKSQNSERLPTREEFRSHLEPSGVVQRKNVDRHSSNGREPLDEKPSKNEMLRPLVSAGMIEGDDLTGLGDQAGEIRTFVKIASVARKGEVVRVIGPTMLLCYDVLNVVREVAVLLAEQAILAAVPRPSSDEVSRGSVHR